MATIKKNVVGIVPSDTNGMSVARMPVRRPHTHDVRMWPRVFIAHILWLSLPALFQYRQQASIVKMRLGDEYHRYYRFRTRDPSVWPV